jgi:hypothetical protein
LPGEQRVEVAVGQPVRVFGVGLQSHQVHHVDHPDLEFRKVGAQQVGGGQDLQGGDVTGAREYHVRFVVAGASPWQDAQPADAVRDRLIHPQIGERGLFAGDYHVHVVAAAQAMIGDRQQCVGVRRQVHPDDLGLLVDRRHQRHAGC